MCPQTSTKRTGFLRSLRNQRGQGLIEAGITVAIFTSLTMGIVDLGRTFMIANVITNAARDGARAMAMYPTRSNGLITSSDFTAYIKPQIVSQIQNVTNLAFSITPAQTPSTGGVVTPPTVPYVSVTISGEVPYVFKLFGDTFRVNRTVTFRDEGR